MIIILHYIYIHFIILFDHKCCSSQFGFIVTFLSHYNNIKFFNHCIFNFQQSVRYFLTRILFSVYQNTAIICIIFAFNKYIIIVVISSIPILMSVCLYGLSPPYISLFPYKMSYSSIFKFLR